MKRSYPHVEHRAEGSQRGLHCMVCDIQEDFSRHVGNLWHSFVPSFTSLELIYAIYPVGSFLQTKVWTFGLCPVFSIWNRHYREAEFSSFLKVRLHLHCSSPRDIGSMKMVKIFWPFHLRKVEPSIGMARI